MDLDLAAGLTARPPRRDDLPAQLVLASAYEQRVLGEALVDLDDPEADGQRAAFVPERDAVLVWDGDRAVAYAEVHKARRANACTPTTGAAASGAHWSTEVPPGERITARGSPRSELSTDSRTGALTLYERLGMKVRRSFTHWAAGQPLSLPATAASTSPIVDSRSSRCTPTMTGQDR
ncbi:MAG: hypothetical protein JWM62_326 [Frankiales bacterium]|nr:hypothetical protein [Frankiales bacterium]